MYKDSNFVIFYIIVGQEINTPANLY